eukprot:4640806-Heterocapsa_arctica.AAC.1
MTKEKPDKERMRFFLIERSKCKSGAVQNEEIESGLVCPALLLEPDSYSGPPSEGSVRPRAGAR